MTPTDERPLFHAAPFLATVHDVEFVEVQLTDALFAVVGFTRTDVFSPFTLRSAVGTRTVTVVYTGEVPAALYGPTQESEYVDVVVGVTP